MSDLTLTSQIIEAGLVGNLPGAQAVIAAEELIEDLGLDDMSPEQIDDVIEDLQNMGL